MGYDWSSSKWREGWYQRKTFEKKRRPLWILIGFLTREIALFVVWALSRS